MMSKKLSKAFFVAVRKGDVVAVQSALADGADPNGRDEYQLTPLMWAARRGHFSVFSELMKAGADLNAVDLTKSTFLHHAVLFRHLEFLRDALSVGGIPLNEPDLHGFTPLDLAMVDEKLVFREAGSALLRKAGAKPEVYKNGGF
jgi:ankyrin repeat protein